MRGKLRICEAIEWWSPAPSYFENKIYSKNLLETNELASIPVKVSPHRTLNYSHCVLLCKELVGIEEEEIKKTN